MSPNVIVLPPDQLSDLARWMRGVPPDGWLLSELRDLLGARGWELGDGPGHVVRTGLTTGDGRLMPVDSLIERFTTAFESVIGLAVPVGVADPSVVAQAECFRQAASSLTEVLGPATVLGTHSAHGPFYVAGPAWGNPYLRWRRPAPGDTIELRAGVRGPELVLQPTAPAEYWLLKQQWGTFPISGILAELSTNDPASKQAYLAHGHTLAGLETPGMLAAANWEDFERGLADMLSTVSAEQHALRMGFAPVIGSRQGFSFDVNPSNDRVVIAGFVPGSVDAVTLGWIAAAEVPDDPYGTGGPEWRLVGAGIGETDGAALARTVVETARACGLATPDDLEIMDGNSERSRDGINYWYRYYGLGLRDD